MTRCFAQCGDRQAQDRSENRWEALPEVWLERVPYRFRAGGKGMGPQDFLGLLNGPSPAHLSAVFVQQPAKR
jgi:hypothetical protein